MNVLSKWEHQIKIIILIIGGAYFIFSTTETYDQIAEKMIRESIRKKSDINFSHVDILIVGGSNAATGISALMIEQHMRQTTTAINLAIAEEGGGINYFSWVNERVKTADIVIYSTMEFWDLYNQNPIYNHKKGNRLDSSNKKIVPIYKAIKNTIARYTFNSRGDWADYQCSYASPFVTEGIATRPTMPLLENRILSLKKILLTIKDLENASEIYLRAPPILVDEMALVDVKNYINVVQPMLLDAGIKLITPSTYVTTDYSDMCFGPNHPNKHSRAKFTEEITSFLVSRSNGTMNNKGGFAITRN